MNQELAPNAKSRSRARRRLILVPHKFAESDPAFYDYSVPGNDAQVTLGSDPDATGSFHDGHLQVFKLVAYTQ